MTLESSSDGGATWQEFEHWSGWSGKRWGTASRWTSARCPATCSCGGAMRRTRSIQGRGVYVDGIHVASRADTVFDDSRRGDASAVQVDGWAASTT